MIKRLLLAAAALAVCCGIIPARAHAQDSSDLKYKYGFYERLRHEFWKNNRDMENNYYDGGDRNFWRIKTSVWGQLDLKDMLSFYAKLTNEVKGYNLLGSGGRKIYSTGHQHWDPDEVIFDQLFLDIKKPADLPVSFRIGRQDLIGQYGENFLICDGTPGDGSRTFYFNALKASWTVDAKNTLDVIYINNPRDDIWLPVLNEDKSPVALTTTAEEGVVVYLKSKPRENVNFEPYFIYKHEDDDWGSGLQARDSKIYTPGVFVKAVDGPWTYRLQAARQDGKYGSDDREATGGYAFVDRLFKDAKWSPEVSMGFVYLSGDKKGSVEQEGWNPLFTRFPLYSELYAQAYQSESGNSYWTNLEMLRAGITVKPSAKIKYNFNYSFLRANELVTASATANLSGTGKNRGHLFTSKLDYTISKNMTAYLLAEYFLPKHKFYTNDADPAIFVRTQLEMKF